MSKVLLFQTDNRMDVDYLGLTKNVNNKIADYLNNYIVSIQSLSSHSSSPPLLQTTPLRGSDVIESLPFEDKDDLNNDHISYSHHFYLMNEKHYMNLHPATGKINVVYDLLNGNIIPKVPDPDIIVFLDSDAWIQNPHYLHDLIKRFIESGKEGCFSRDPYLSRNDYINSGSFIIKNNDYIKTMYKEIQETMQQDNSHHHSWSYDQYYISKEIFKRKDDFLIFIPHIINTPEGQIIRHHWYKTYTMYSDLYDLLDENKSFVKPDTPYDFSDKMDDRPYPNPNTYDYEYHR